MTPPDSNQPPPALQAERCPPGNPTQDDAVSGGDRQPPQRDRAGSEGPPRGLGPPVLRALLVPPLAYALAAGCAMLADDALAGLHPRVAMRSADLLFELAASLWLLLWLPALWVLLDRRPLRELGYAGPAGRVLRGLGLGVLVGGGAMAAVVAAGAALGAYRISLAPPQDAPALPSLLLVGAILLLASHAEELVLRGYVLQNLGRGRPFLALALTSILFAALHAGNPGLEAAPPAQVAVVLLNVALAGLLLGAAFLLAGDLWLPTGIHVGWNVTQGMVLGFPVSGFAVPSALRGEVAPGAGLLGGGTFGPESSLLGLAVLAPITAALVARAARVRAVVPVVAARGGQRAGAAAQ